MVTETNKLAELIVRTADELSLFRALPISENGRELRPSRIVSLYDIVKPFLAGNFIRLSAMLGEASAYTSVVASGKAPPEIQQKAASHFNDLKKQCFDHQLLASFTTACKIANEFEQDEPDWNKVHIWMKELRERLVDETALRQYFSLSLEETEVYMYPQHGWEVIVERFPTSLADIEESWKCYALSRYTAAVFHSLQIVEVGLIDLGKFIGVNDPLSGWTAVTQRLNAILKADHKTLSSFEQQNRSFLEQLQGTIAALKNAWRNKVSHVGQKLTLMTGAEFHPNVAEEILIATRAFMRRLSEGLPPAEEPAK